MRFTQKQTCLALVLAMGLGAGAARADVVFSDSMDYANNAAIQAVWSTVVGANAQVRTGAITFGATPLAGITPTPATAGVLALGEGIVYRELSTTVTGDWTLELKMLHANYQRGEAVFLLDATGTQGYGLLWDSSGANQFSSEGAVSIRKYNNSNTSSWSAFGTGSALGALTESGHWVTGYEVTNAPDSNQNNATFNTSSWADMADVKLTWESATGQLTLYVDGVQIDQITDADYASFSRIYLRGNSLGYFDQITVDALVPEPSALGLVGIGGAMMLVRKRTTD